MISHSFFVDKKGNRKVIYNNIPPGIPMKTTGCTAVNVIRPNGNTATVYYGTAQPANLYVDVYIKIISGSPDEDYIKSQLEAMTFEIGQAAEAVSIAVVVKDAIGEIGTPYDVGVSLTNGSYSEIVSPSAPDEYFTISAANITIHQVS